MPSTTLNIQKIQHLCNQLGVSRRELAYYLENSERHRYEKEKRGPKKNGKVRILEPPVDIRKALQRKLNAILQRVELPDYFHGGVPGHTHITNARKHLNKPLVQKFDLKDFFRNITSGAVYRMFVHQLRCSPDVARCLTRLTTHKGHVPQGSPTSSLVSLLVFIPASLRMKALADQHHRDFTVYVDDLTFSGPPAIEKFTPLLTNISHQHGFIVNEDKSIAMTMHEEQTVTGVGVNGRNPAMPREKKDDIFRELARLESAFSTMMPPATEIRSFIGTLFSMRPLARSMVNQILRRDSVRAWRANMKDNAHAVSREEQPLSSRTE